MRLKYSSLYNRKFYQLSDTDQKISRMTIELFRENPHHTSLRNHPLKKPMQYLRSISVTDDMRIVFREKGEYSEVLFISIGDHPSVYRS